VDRQVQRLVDHLRENRLWERTLIVVAGDHGESLGEHDEQEHGLTLYNSVLHVPWIWAGRGVTVAGRRIQQPVSLVDLRPTLLEAVGLRDPAPISGHSLRAALTGGEIPAEECYSATDEPLLAQGWSPLRSLTTARWKYIRSPEVELYDLASDPQETRNLAQEQSEQVRDLDNRLVSREQAMVTRQAAAVTLSPKERQALESLGYLGGGSQTALPAADREALPDVKHILPFYNKVVSAYRLMFDGDAPAAERRLRELLHEAPQDIRARLYLASVLEEQKEFNESREVLEEILEQDPDNSEAHFQLGVVYWSQEQYSRAAEEFRKSLVTEPDAARGLFSLAKTLVKLGEVEDAEQSFRQALEVDPAYVSAHLSLGILLAGQRRAAEAEQHFREALEYTPGSAQAHLNLAILLMEQNRPAESGEHFAWAVRLAPKDPELYINYGTVLLLTGRRDDAIRALEEALRLDPHQPQALQRLKEARGRRGR
jgi:tetratricopeptide (TPR) repeat protein